MMRNQENTRRQESVDWNNGCQEKNGNESRNERELNGKEQEVRSPRFGMLIYELGQKYPLNWTKKK